MAVQRPIYVYDHSDCYCHCVCDCKVSYLFGCLRRESRYNFRGMSTEASSPGLLLEGARGANQTQYFELTGRKNIRRREKHKVSNPLVELKIQLKNGIILTTMI